MAEVEIAMNQMAKDKAPGPDGFTTNSFHASWNWMKYEIVDLVEDSRKSGSVLKALNSTFLALIPKESRTEDPSKLRPIALCNVIYKIITKVIANHLKPILPLIISSEQVGFVEGRQILDDIILVHETIHSLKATRTPGMLLKLDLSKSYDKLNWQFLSGILKAFGFAEDWTNWIMNMVSSSFFSILVNGSPSNPFNATRRIRQGDPLSPFLFIIAAEGLGILLKNRRAKNKIHGLSLMEGMDPQTHQQFADEKC